MGKKKASTRGGDDEDNDNDISTSITDRRLDKNDKKYKPFVSICTPTYNRRPFIPFMLKCFEHQDYPKDRIEWIIIDDGTDPIEDLVKDHPNIKYFKYDTKMTLGKKRNLMHEKTCGEIIVYMDDDDYYPPMRISHAVHMLMTHPKALCAGSSEIYIYFKHIDKMYQFGPYGPNHSTAGTFAFKRELLNLSKYDENAALAEEKEFLKNYTIPFVQLDPLKVILVFSHIQNTFDKKRLLEGNPDPRFCKPSDRTVDEFVKEAELKEFYMNEIESLLINYAPGSPEMKPDVLQQIKEIDAKRKKDMDERMAQQQSQGQIVINKDGQQIVLNNQQIVQLLQQQQSQTQEMIQQFTQKEQQYQFELNMKDNIIREKDKEIESLKDEIDTQSSIVDITDTKNTKNVKIKDNDESNESSDSDSSKVNSENSDYEDSKIQLDKFNKQLSFLKTELSIKNKFIFDLLKIHQEQTG
jgi:glycosyltransferase involved in cell wall biosynthesis